MKPTPGKLAGLKAVSDARGVIAAAAMDQRGSLQKSLAHERGGVVQANDLEEFKTLVTDVLTRYSSAILLDPEFGLGALKNATPPACCLPTKKPDTTPPPPAACPTCSTTGRCDA